MKNPVSIVTFALVLCFSGCALPDSKINHNKEKVFREDEFRERSAPFEFYKEKISNNAIEKISNVKETIEDKVATFKPNWNYGWIKRQDVFSGDQLSLIAVGVSAFAAGVAFYALMQNSDSNSKYDSQETRLSSVCSAAQGVGNTALTLSAVSDFSGDDTGTDATNLQIRTRLNLIETAINNFVTPTCT